MLKYVGCVEAHARTPKLSFPVFAYSPAPMRGSSASSDATEDDTSLDVRRVSPPALSHTTSVDRYIYRIKNQPPALQLELQASFLSPPFNDATTHTCPRYCRCPLVSAPLPQLSCGICLQVHTNVHTAHTT